jgi:hypothetical protein
LQAGGGFFDVPLPALWERPPEIEWKDIAATVMVTSDTPAEARYPDTATDAQNDQTSLLYIRIGDRARMDYLAKGTILDIADDGTPIKAAAGGFIRSDFDYMKDIAQTAWEWYQTSRIAFQLEYRQLSNLFAVGEMIQSIGTAGVASSDNVTWPDGDNVTWPDGDNLTWQATSSSRDVNSVITSVTWDFVKGSTVIETAFTNDLDFAELV